MDIINLDYESRSEEDLIASGLDRYANHDSTEIVMAAWSINGEAIEQWDLRERARPPSILIDALRDPNVQKWAYNAQFERVMTEKCWGIESDYANWRCTQVLAYMMGFAGTLDNVGRAMKLAADKRKMAEGKKLIQLFCRPQKITTNQPHQWRDWRTAFAVPFIRQQLHLTLLLRKTQILLRHNEKSTLVVCRRRNRIPEDGL